MKSKILSPWKISSFANSFMIRKFFLFRFMYGLTFFPQKVNGCKKIIFDEQFLFKLLSFLESKENNWKVDLFGNVKILRFFFCCCGEKFAHLLQKKKILPITCFHLNQNFSNKMETKNALPLTYKILNSIFDTRSSRLILPIKNLTGYGGFTGFKKFETKLDKKIAIEMFKNFLNRINPENVVGSSFYNSDKLSTNSFLKTYVSTDFIIDYYIFFSKSFKLLTFS